MYDVLNTKNGYFSANGIIVHNSAADMSKKAMLAVHNNEELNELKGKLLIPVHDELIIKAPLRYAKEVKTIFATAMEKAADDKLTIPISCDVTVSYSWYGDELNLDEELNELKDK